MDKCLVGDIFRMLTHRVSIGEETETKIILNKDWRKGFLLLLSYSSATFTRKLIKEPFLLRLCLSVEIKVPQLRVRGYLKKKMDWVTFVNLSSCIVHIITTDHLEAVTFPSHTPRLRSVPVKENYTWASSAN